MLAAYVDLKKTFDSVHRETLRSSASPWDSCKDYLSINWTVSAVKCGGGVSSFFPVNTGVRQGCVFAP